MVNPPASVGDAGFSPWVGKIPWSSKWQLTPVFLPGEFYGERSLVGYSPWGHGELDASVHAHVQYTPYEQIASSWSFSLHAIQLTYVHDYV